MIFAALLAALLLEYFRPLPRDFYQLNWFSKYVNYVEGKLNAGEHRHGILAWFMALAPFVLLASAISIVLNMVSGLLMWAWSLSVLYLLMGFSEVGANAALVSNALRNQQLDLARSVLEQWEEQDKAEISASEVARLGIEATLVSAYHRLFGIVIWFVLLGPVGALFYRLAQILAGKWGGMSEHEFGDFGKFSMRAFAWMEWFPARLTALSFAIVGNFEDAMYCWRAQAKQWVDENLGVVLASGAGAMGVKLGATVDARTEIGLGDDADVDYLDSAVSLIWRTLTLWLALLLLITLARWTGS